MVSPSAQLVEFRHELRHPFPELRPCASEMLACRMNPHSFPARYAASDPRAATSKSLKSRGIWSSSGPTVIIERVLPFLDTVQRKNRTGHRPPPRQKACASTESLPPKFMETLRKPRCRGGAIEH